MNVPQVFDIDPKAVIVGCRSCGARIVFAITSKGKRMPVEAEGETRGQSHFAFCNDPKRFRKRERVANKPTA